MRMMKPFVIALSGMGRRLQAWGKMVGMIQPMYDVSLFGVVTMILSVK
jgi:hypothetical protein